MQKSPTWVFLFFGLLILGCKEETPATQLIVNLANTKLDKIEVSNLQNEILESATGPLDTLSLVIQEEVILDLVNKYTHYYVHLKPGTSLSIDTISSDPLVLGVVGNSTPENDYLKAYDQLLAERTKAYPMRTMAKSMAGSFVNQLNEKHRPMLDFLEQVQKDDKVSEKFKMVIKHRLAATKGNDLLTFKGYHNYLNKEYPEIPEGFYSEIAAMDFTDPSLLTFEEGKQLGISWHGKDLDYKDFSSDGDYFNGLLKSAREKYTPSLMQDYCFFDVVNNQVNFGLGIDHSEALINNFKSKVSNNYLLKKVDTTIEPWLALKAGTTAPDIVARDRSGKAIPISQLKGKKVYIDVWATWCGPCIKEIPALKELEVDLHDEAIEFVSISIDKEKDKEKWMKFIEEKEMKGVQLMADGDWKSDVVNSYNIKGIPRFLLIDEAGKIVSANAPRPSDPKIKEVLLN